MAMARNVVDGDKQGLKWLEILDTDGDKWKYYQAGPATPGATVHVYQHDDGKLEIMPNGKGGLLLCRDEAGLPRTINVRLAAPQLPTSGTVVVAGFGGGVFVYEQR